MITNDQELLQQYVEQGSEEAFAGLVKRYVDLVYSAALRQIHDPALAQDVTQAVFILLARKARTLSAETIVSGWLVRTTRFTAGRALRTEFRRKRMEGKLLEMNITENGSEATWTQIAPVLDSALAKLRQKERDAIVLRFFEDKTFAEVGAALATTEEAAKKRVNRGLEKLRSAFGKRSLMVSCGAIATALASESVKAAPGGLAASISAQGLSGAADSGAALLVKETLSALFWNKLKAVTATAMACMVGMGGAGVAAWKLQATEQNTPKSTLRYLARTFSEGDGRAFMKAVDLTVNRSPESAARWVTTLEKLVTAQGALRKATTERFGADSVREAMPFWQTVTKLIDQIAISNERVDGSQAKFPIRLFGQTYQDIPLLIQTNGAWRLAVNLQFNQRQQVKGRNRNSLAFAMEGNGIQLALTTRPGFGTEQARIKFASWADVLNRVAAEVRRGKFESADSAWATCSAELENIGGIE